MQTKNILFTEYPLNELLTLKNRIVMAPMTRAKADAAFVPTKAMADYYARRADAGLIITEGTVISADARGHYHVPGIFTSAQIEHWHRVTDAVHARHGIIFCQIWHVGRVSHPAFLKGQLPISASATTMSGAIARSGGLTFGSSREATLDEIKILIAAYATAAKNAIAAGFDGVEIHGANGYLIDQFLHHHTNLRQDQYGGSIENRARFALEVVQAVGKAIGFQRVALRLSPGGYLNQIVGDKRDVHVFNYLFEQLNQLPIAYLHTGNFDHTKLFEECDGLSMTHFMRRFYQGTLVATGGYDVTSAGDGVSQHQFDLAAFGRPFIANPDLIARLRDGLPLVQYDAGMLATLY